MSTNIEILERLEKIHDFVITGKSYNDIKNTISSEYNISVRQVERYIKTYYDLRAYELKQQLPYIITESIIKLDYLYSKALEDNDYKLAFNILKEKNHIQGIDKSKYIHSVLRNNDTYINDHVKRELFNKSRNQTLNVMESLCKEPTKKEIEDRTKELMNPIDIDTLEVESV